MDISSILKPEAVRVIGETSSKKRLFQRLGEAAQSIYGLDGPATVDALLERESLGPTGVGKGIALPHARLSGLTSVVGLFFRLERPLDFDSVDRQPVDLVFALFAPEESGVDHLKALALVSRTMRDNGTCAKLRANDDPATLHTILTEGPATKAA
jgi:PTS system nitrogen regulatory IIA component